VDYTQEPEEIFLPLDEKRYCEFYDVEMAGFTSDLPFYLSLLPPAANILELGCGNGRLARALAAAGHSVTGIDISAPMLASAAALGGEHITYVRMDMAEFMVPDRFDAVIIAYNTLNLLGNLPIIERCLKRTRGHLKEGGQLLLQTFQPRPDEFPSDGGGAFQFRIFALPGGGKLIKETIKRSRQKEIELTERYRVRPADGNSKNNEDLAHTLYLAAIGHEKLTELLTTAGFTTTCRYGGYDLSPFVPERDGLLLLAARAS
jgi:SAM-dependent methyltransferase